MRYNRPVREDGAISTLTIQPTTKFLTAGAILAGLVVLALEVFCLVSGLDHWVMIPPLFILLWPATRALRRHFTKATVSGDRLRYETGFASKSTRTIQLSKIQDVRVDQRLMQRILNVGDLAIETAGETSRLVIHDVDDPQQFADELTERSQQSTRI